MKNLTEILQRFIDLEIKNKFFLFWDIHAQHIPFYAFHRWLLLNSWGEMMYNERMLVLNAKLMLWRRGKDKGLNTDRTNILHNFGRKMKSGLQSKLFA